MHEENAVVNWEGLAYTGGVFVVVPSTHVLLKVLSVSVIVEVAFL